MKQKFTITIADIEMNILSEGSADEVETTVSKVDRRIREICQKSSRISKNEAALLAALEFCAQCETVQKDINQNDEEYEELREENAKLADAYEKLTARMTAQKEKYEAAAAAQKERYETAAATQKEKYEGRIEIMKEKYEGRIAVLRARMDEMRKTAEFSPQQISINSPAADGEDKSSEEPVAESANEPNADAAEQITVGTAAEAEADTAETKKESRAKGKNSKVGTMFELLTFNDV